MENIEQIEKLIEPESIETIRIVEKIINTDVKDIIFEGTKFHGDNDKIAEFMKSFSKFFSAVTNPKNTKVNPFLKNKYSPLDVVLNCLREPMSEQGLSFIQIPTTNEDSVKVDTILMHENGCYMSIEGISMKPKKMDAQEIGGIITYIRRYTISAICGISSEEDDDGNSTSGKKPTIKAIGEDELKVLAITTLKAKVTTLAKDKMAEVDKTSVTKEIESVLGEGNTVSKSTEEDRDKLVKLYISLSKLS